MEFGDFIGSFLKVFLLRKNHVFYHPKSAFLVTFSPRIVIIGGFVHKNYYAIFIYFVY